MKKEYSFSLDLFESADALADEDAALLAKAREVTANAYAPYSQFHVGAVAKLANGEIISGTNQENASYPIGICAERVLLSAASAVHPQVPIETIWILILIAFHWLSPIRKSFSPARRPEKFTPLLKICGSSEMLMKCD